MALIRVGNFKLRDNFDVYDNDGQTRLYWKIKNNRISPMPNNLVGWMGELIIAEASECTLATFICDIVEAVFFELTSLPTTFF